MPFNFADIPGISADVVTALQANAQAVEFANAHDPIASIESAVTNRVDVAKASFKTKMDALNAKLVAAEERLNSGETIDADELAALRAIRDKSPELQATLDALKAKGEQDSKELTETRAAMDTMRLGQEVDGAIAAYNAEYPTVQLQADAREHMLRMAPEALRYDEATKQYQVFDKSGNIVATDKGAATPVDWIFNQRKTSPSLFVKPTGGGAPGNNNSGGADNQMSRADFGKLPPMEQAKAAKTHTIVD